MRHAGLVREVALALAVARDEPDVPTLVAALVAQERELRGVRRPARRDAAFDRVRGELVDGRLFDWRAVDLEVAGLVPREGDLVAQWREIDRAEVPVDVRRAD